MYLDTLIKAKEAQPMCFIDLELGINDIKYIVFNFNWIPKFSGVSKTFHNTWRFRDAADCGYPLQCVKCAEDKYKLMLKRDATPPKWVVCDGSHPGIYRACTVYRIYKVNCVPYLYYFYCLKTMMVIISKG